MDDITAEFLAETRESLDRLDHELIALEQDASDRPIIASVFRTVHNIKGTAGFLGYAKLGAVAHAGESLLSDVRDGRLSAGRAVIDALLALVDAVREMLASIERAGTDGDADPSEIIARLEAAASASGHTNGSHPVPAAAAAPAAGQSAALPRASAAAASHPTLDEALDLHSHTSDGTVRVDVERLDRLMNLAGELVLARNGVMQAALRESPAVVGACRRLNLIASELQTGIMKTRMLPIAGLWGRFPRLVRDLAAACGKQVRIRLEGGSTELDRAVIEAVRDPLTHLLRNAVDHGIEAPARRAAAGKPPEGLVTLRSFHEGGNVVVEIADDGAGINLQAVRTRAARNGVCSAEQAARMADSDVLNLIFLPGFSTAERVTGVSGRGVGMDVVKSNIERIGGTVDIRSSDRGTTVRLRIPLTLAIVPALTVSTGTDSFTVPLANVSELVRLSRTEDRRDVEFVQGAPVCRLRGRLLPLVDLAELLAPGQASKRWAGDASVNIVVVEADEVRLGLVVDAIHDHEDIVVKPLHKQLRTFSVYSGATILGDGRPALILDVGGVARQAGLSSIKRRTAPGTQAESVEDRQAGPDGRRNGRGGVLLFEGVRGGRMAVPLAAVSRLEEFAPSAVERAGRLPVIQYRGEILPLIDLSAALGGEGASPGDAPGRPAAEAWPVVVCSTDAGRVGVVVGRILDIAEEEPAAKSRSLRHGIKYTGVVGGAITEFVDVEGLVRTASPALAELLESPEAQI